MLQNTQTRASTWNAPCGVKVGLSYIVHEHRVKRHPNRTETLILFKKLICVEQAETKIAKVPKGAVSVRKFRAER